MIVLSKRRVDCRSVLSSYTSSLTRSTHFYSSFLRRSRRFQLPFASVGSSSSSFGRSWNNYPKKSKPGCLP